MKTKSKILTAQHSTAQHSTAQHSTAQHNYLLISSSCQAFSKRIGVFA